MGHQHFRPWWTPFFDLTLENLYLFFYDILIYCPTWNCHLKHVKQTLEILREQQFFIKVSKCNFGQQELEYLGHVVTYNALKVDEKKIATMVSWPWPQNISELKGISWPHRLLPKVCARVWVVSPTTYKSPKKGTIRLKWWSWEGIWQIEKGYD